MPNLKGDITISTDNASKFQKDSLLRWHTVANEKEKHFKVLFSKVC